ncbi:hypothetical protein IWQ62_000962 [Dispira parvispora]|uniref:Uncharacterized protein n=1 Tax=Dispira parvispora TaxID=1520584 RepID=A0A9W8ATN5_9FUNG|nr:hypothetical protein IWQ62_000962 [Dispira parvispora]
MKLVLFSLFVILFTTTALVMASPLSVTLARRSPDAQDSFGEAQGSFDKAGDGFHDMWHGTGQAIGGTANGVWEGTKGVGKKIKESTSNAWGKTRDFFGDSLSSLGNWLHT